MKMKLPTALIALVIMFMFGCAQNEIGYYDQDPRLDFRGFSNIGDQALTELTEFNDEDYVNGITEKTDSVAVVVLGRVVPSPMSFCLTTEPDSTAKHEPEVVFAPEYIQPAGTYVSWAKYVVKRPELYDTSYECYIVFDLKNPAHKFLPGRVEAAKMGCTVEFKLEPIEGWNNKLWNPEFLGVYSNGKYKFMLDEHKKPYKKLTVDAAFKDDIKARYAAYKAGGEEPIMDDQKVPQEIVFPD